MSVQVQPKQVAEIKSIIRKKSCGFLGREDLLSDGTKTISKFYFRFSDVVGKPSDLTIGATVTFRVNPALVVPIGKYPIALDVELVSGVQQ